MEEKQWYKSSTIQSVVVIIFLVILQMLTGDGQMADTIDKIGEVGGNNKELIMQLVTIAAGGLAIRGRVKAKTTIKKKENGNG